MQTVARGVHLRAAAPPDTPTRPPIVVPAAPAPPALIAIEVNLANTLPAETRGMVDCHHAAKLPFSTPLAANPMRRSTKAMIALEATAPKMPVPVKMSAAQSTDTSWSSGLPTSASVAATSCSDIADSTRHDRSCHGRVRFETFHGRKMLVPPLRQVTGYRVQL